MRTRVFFRFFLPFGNSWGGGGSPFNSLRSLSNHLPRRRVFRFSDPAGGGGGGGGFLATGATRLEKRRLGRRRQSAFRGAVATSSLPRATPPAAQTWALQNFVRSPSSRRRVPGVFFFFSFFRFLPLEIFPFRGVDGGWRRGATRVYGVLLRLCRSERRENIAAHVRLRPMTGHAPFSRPIRPRHPSQIKVSNQSKPSRTAFSPLFLPSPTSSYLLTPFFSFVMCAHATLPSRPPSETQKQHQQRQRVVRVFNASFVFSS